VFFGLSGKDAFFGGPGNDDIRGGIGNDIAILNGSMADYKLTPGFTGNFTLSDKNKLNGNEGTDTLRGVELLLYKDAIYEISSESRLQRSIDTLVNYGFSSERSRLLLRRE